MAMKFMDLEKIDDFKKYLGDPRTFIEKFCYITTKTGEFQKLKLNYPQRKLMNVVEKGLKEQKPIRIRVLKARQMGFSTLISALGFWWAAMNENSSYAVVAHKDSSASSIFEKNKIFYDNLPSALKPQTDKFNSERISFNTPGKAKQKGLRSKIFFGTAGGGELFRGETILFLHKSEVAFWEDKNGVLKKSLNAAVPYEPFTCMIEETTANGYNQFKDDWDRSAKGKDGYVPIFVGWNEMKEYRLTPPPNFELTQEELALQMDHDLTDDQLYWRRVKIEDDYSGNTLFFQQEYPLTPQEAFIASGAGVFKQETIALGYEYAQKPKFKKPIESVLTNEELHIWEKPYNKEVVEYQKLSRWNDEKQAYEYYDGDIEIDRYTVQENYTLGIDTSGLGSDWNRFIVMSDITKRVVAKFSVQKMNEEKLGKIAVEIARYYNNALIAPEVNYSHAICDYIVEEGYERIYLTENLSRIDRKKEAYEYGWNTTKLTKPPLISNLRARLNEDPSIVPDEDFWYEAEYYLLEDPATNKMNAASGHHDDILMATAIAHQVANCPQATPRYTQKREEESEERKEDKKHFLEGFFGIPKSQGPKGKTNKLKKGVYKNHA